MSDADLLQQFMFPRVLMISVGHLSAGTARFFRDHDAADWPVLGGHFGDVGFMLWVDEGAAGMAPHLPPDLRDVFDYAALQGAVMVIFQDVSPVVPGLQIYRGEDGFDAERFLARDRKSWEEVEDYWAERALERLTDETGSKEMPILLIAEMSQILEELAIAKEAREVLSLPYERLQKFADVISSVRLLAVRRPETFRVA